MSISGAHETKESENHLKNDKVFLYHLPNWKKQLFVYIYYNVCQYNRVVHLTSHKSKKQYCTKLPAEQCKCVVCLRPFQWILIAFCIWHQAQEHKWCCTSPKKNPSKCCCCANHFGHQTWKSKFMMMSQVLACLKENWM